MGSVKRWKGAFSAAPLINITPGGIAVSVAGRDNNREEGRNALEAQGLRLCVRGREFVTHTRAALAATLQVYTGNKNKPLDSSVSTHLPRLYAYRNNHCGSVELCNNIIKIRSTNHTRPCAVCFSWLVCFMIHTRFQPSASSNHRPIFLTKGYKKSKENTNSRKRHTEESAMIRTDA